MAKVKYLGIPAWSGEYLRQKDDHRTHGEAYSVEVEPFTLHDTEQTAVRVEFTYHLKNEYGPDTVFNEQWDVLDVDVFVSAPGGGKKYPDWISKDRLFPGGWEPFEVPDEVAEAALQAAKEYRWGRYASESREYMVLQVEQAKRELEQYSEARTKKHIESILREAEQKRKEATALIEAWERWSTDRGEVSDAFD